MRDIDHLVTAVEMLEIADERGGWLEDGFSAREQWAIQQHNLAAIAHALIAIAQNGDAS